MTTKKPREAEEILDRLSDLPDHIIHKIFWFLDIRYAIKTCVLSRRWRYLWASLPDLKFVQYEPKAYSSLSFTRFVCKVLLNRDNNCSIGHLKFSSYWAIDQSLLDTVVNYAVSHHIRKFYISLYSLQSLSLLPELLTCESLKSLNLCRFEFEALPDSFGLGFTNLTSLDLFTCEFGFAKGDNIIGDPFANCPSLTHLCLRNCKFSSIKLLKITGLQLINLEIDSMGHGFSALPNGFRVEIFAPKLENFWFENSYAMEFSHLYLPSLTYVEISVWANCSDKRRANLNLIDMFQNLGNASSVWLHPQTFEVLDWCPELLQQKTSPFKRLRFFTVPCMLDSFTIPAHVASYFLGSTSPAEPTHTAYIKTGDQVVRTLCYRPMVQA